MVWIIGHILAVCIGISLGLIGGGGSILAAPILIYVMAVPSKSAFAMTLVIVGVVSLIGVIPHWRQGNVNLKTAAIFSPPAMVGAYVGARIASLPVVDPIVQLLAFTAMMIIAAIAMIRKSSQRQPATALDTTSGPIEADLDTDLATDLESVAAQPQPSHTHQSWLSVAAEGLGVGAITGFIGIGGGFLVIPALVLLGGTPMKEAIGTSLVILALKAVTGFAGYLGRVPIDWNLMGTFTFAAGFGILIGAYFTQFVDPKHLEKGFGYFVLAVAAFILIQQFPA
jgi:hypothetical protein